MPLAKLPEKTIITTLFCPRCGGVGRLFRKGAEEAPARLEGAPQAEYFYTLRCPQCGEIELWGLAEKPATGASPP